MYAVGAFLIGLYYRVRCRVKIYGAENIPENSGAVLCSNHINLSDPLIYAVYLKRPLYFLSKSELFVNPFVSWILKKVHCVSLDRGKTDTKAYKRAVTLLKENKILCIFAQGTRVKEEEVKAAKSGAVLFAIKGGVPIIPVAIKYNEKKFTRVIVRIGKPLLMDNPENIRLNSETLRDLTDSVMEKINKLYVAQ